MATPLEFDQAIADEICERLAKGDSLRKVCGEERAEHLPGQTTVYRWLDENEAFAKQYARSRDRQGDTYADRAVDEALTATDAALGRLKMDALKWAASKLAPKKYSDKVEIEHTGKVKITTIRLVGPDDDGAD
jgi:hypothetical protein